MGTKTTLSSGNDIFAAEKVGGITIIFAPAENPSPSAGKIPVQFLVTLLLESSSWCTLMANETSTGTLTINVIRSDVIGAK